MRLDKYLKVSRLTAVRNHTISTSPPPVNRASVRWISRPRRRGRSRS